MNLEKAISNYREIEAERNNNPSDEQLRQLWLAAGGSFHGPNVETGTIPEADLLPFLRLLIRRDR